MSCKVKDAFITSPIGKMVLSYCSNGLHYVKQVEFITDELFKPNKKCKVNLLQPSDAQDDTIVVNTVKWFQVYFTDPQKVSSLTLPDICVASDDGSFREKVWLSLAHNVKAGETISYGNLAKLMSNPGASRAVGTAMSNNPIQIIVPCHRVIKNDGSFGNYAKGCRNDVKKWLLEFEGAVS